jgi:hypothetical protein
MRVNSDGNLRCPQCSDKDNDLYPYLHHRGVRVFSRGEDDEETRETIVLEDQTIVRMVPSLGSHNPSSRRDGITINFECELCGNASRLTIAQHKGSTFVRWER